MNINIKNVMVSALLLAGAAQTRADGTFANPVIPASLPDPTVVRADDGYFYLYATEDVRNMPIYRSPDLVDWKFVGTAFTPETRPKWNAKGGLWAPDINRIGGKYVLYYSKSEWGGEWTCGIGVATADRPEGPFADHGALFISKDIGVRNSIDPFYIEDEGRKYLFWGSFHGIYGIELSGDGLSVKPGAEKRRVAGNFMEGAYIHKRGRYYYLFGSAGRCCEGANSNYRVTFGRSESLFGPYYDRHGRRLLDGHCEVMIHGNETVVGPGHNSEIITDDIGRDWMLYHGYPRADADAGRVVYMSQVKWRDDWPCVDGDTPAASHENPLFGQIYMADPTIFREGDTYYLYGTSPQSANGFWAYMSKDLKNWSGPVGARDGYALNGGTYGAWGFWAPQVFRHDGKYCMAYTANEQLAIAESDSPRGPFTQDATRMLTPPNVFDHRPGGVMPVRNREIDPYVFFDDDGKAYLYHVRLINGNRIYVAELNADMRSVKEETARECVAAEKGTWENTSGGDWGVAEGPTVVKVGKTYYMFYSCNDFRSIDYAVGYATADSPLGPWRKHGKPIISRHIVGENGTGHGDLFRDKDGKWKYVMHVHHSDRQATPRRTAIVELRLKGKEWSVAEGSFRLLHR